MDQLYKIFEVLGPPPRDWKEGQQVCAESWKRLSFKALCRTRFLEFDAALRTCEMGPNPLRTASKGESVQLAETTPATHFE